MKIISYSNLKSPNEIEKIKINKIKKFGIKITKNLHDKFTNFSGDKSLIHTDRKFCQKNGFKNKVGYAFLLSNILSKIYGEYFPGGNELCLQHSEKFIKPYYINDFLIINIKPVQKNNDAKLLTIEIKIKSKNNLIYFAETILKLSLKK
jgi:3-hydroxybutyryl-CoA dehydratase